MPVTFVPAGPLRWEPGEYGQGAMARAENVVPLYGGLRAVESLEVGGSIAASVYFVSSYVHIYPVNPGTATYVGDQPTEFHGTKDDIYVYSGGVLSAISAGGGYASGAEPAAWKFASFGNDVWATNYVDPMQVRANNSGNFANGVTSAFAPQARFIAPVRTFMFAANLNNVGRYADEFCWSVTTNAANYDPGGGGLAGSQRLLSRPGQITGLVGGEFARIFKRNSLHGVTYTGSSTSPFREDIISPGVGTAHSQSIVEARDNSIYFYGADGFYRQEGMSAPVKIGGEIAASLLGDQRFAPAPLKRVVPATMDEEDALIVGTQEPTTGLIVWFYRSGSNATRRMNDGVAYNPSTGEWSSFAFTATDISTVAGVPSLATASAATMPNLLVTTFDGTNARRQTFTSASTCFSWAVATKRFSLGMEGADRLAPRTIVKVMPVVSTRRSAGAITSGSDYPDDLTVEVIGSHDPNFFTRSDGIQTVNPRSFSMSALNADTEFGSWDALVHGRWFIIQLSSASAALSVRSIEGFFVEWN